MEQSQPFEPGLPVTVPVYACPLRYAKSTALSNIFLLLSKNVAIVYPSFKVTLSEGSRADGT
jgi:hypothetical protein